jgi:hypothetical protein
MVISIHPDLWSLACDSPWIDAFDLAAALENQTRQPDMDFRTRLLVRDGLTALEKFWGKARFLDWLAASTQGDALQCIFNENLGPPGFSLLIHGIMETTRTETVLQLLRELGQSIRSEVTIDIGGAAALILRQLISRKTEDIDVVDELPIQIRSEHELLNDLAQRYRLGLTHFQSHYLPRNWQSRLASLDRFGQLTVRLVDPRDIFVGKLFSKREKDRDDLRALARQIDKPSVIQVLLEDGQSLLGEPDGRTQAEKNWYIVFGEPLPRLPGNS